jgi:hypothetical protein
VRFGREINDRFRTVVECSGNCVAIGDVATNEPMAVFVESVHVVEIAGVSQGVEISDVAIFAFFQDQPYESRSDKTGAAGDKNFSHVPLQKQKIE